MPTEDITALLTEITSGNREAVVDLLPKVYQELRQLAQSYLTRERSDHTLVATALVHEAYMKLVDQTRVDWQGQTHFKAVAAQAMMRILIDHGRSRKRQKRGGEWQRVSLDNAFGSSEESDVDIFALQQALEKMKSLDARQAQVVQLHVLGGLTSAETAIILGVSERTVERDWKVGRTWLRRELDKGDPEP